MSKSKIQTPIDSAVLKKVKAKANDLGFSSVNELVRFLLKNFSEDRIDIAIDSISKDYKLKYEWDRSVKEALKEYKAGRIKETHNFGDPNINNMKKDKYAVFPINIEPIQEGGFFAECPSLQGCHVEGDDIVDVIQNIQDVIQVHIEARREHGEKIPSIHSGKMSDVRFNLPIQVKKHA